MLKTCFLMVLATAAFLPAASIVPGDILIRDSFDRFGGEAQTDLGAPEGKAGNWHRRVPVDKQGKRYENCVVGWGKGVRIGYRSGTNPHDTGIWLEEFRLADGCVGITVGRSLIKGRCATPVITYRAMSGETGLLSKDAYHVEIGRDWSGETDVRLLYGKEVLTVADIAPARDERKAVHLEVRFAGDLHQVFVDGKQVIEVWELTRGRKAAGRIGFGGFYSSAVYDDFVVRDAKLSVYAASSFPQKGNRFEPMIFQGRPFFPLGNFDRPRAEDTAEWLLAGGNCYVAHLPGIETSAAERAAALHAHNEWAVAHDAAMLVYPKQNDLWAKNGDTGYRPFTAEERIPRQAYLAEVAKAASRESNTLGYWLLDEPENALYKAYKQWETKRDDGLCEWMVEGMKWTYDTIKENDPESYVMPTIAWYTCYEKLAPLYDVNIPNTYVGKPGEKPSEAPHYNVLYDAAKAADASLAAGKPCFVFMPGTFDVISWGGRPLTKHEMRYSMFAPITQGAMGILSWRLGRCTLPYRRAVVYPVMTEVKQFIPWFLGTWEDENVSSDHDQSTAEYLREFPVRIRLVKDEELAPMEEVPGAPDCSYCLRRRADGSRILLAVNNRREAQRITFTFSGIPKLPKEVKEMLEYRAVRLDENRLSDDFAPFAVHVYRF